MTVAWGLFGIMTDKEACNKVMGDICKVHALYLSHWSRTEATMEKLQCKAYGLMQMAVGCRLQKVLCDEMTMFINQTKSEWKSFDHTSAAQSMVHASDLANSSDFYVPLFGNIFRSWIQDSFPYHDVCVPCLSGVSISALFDCCLDYNQLHSGSE